MVQLVGKWRGHGGTRVEGKGGDTRLLRMYPTRFRLKRCAMRLRCQAKAMPTRCPCMRSHPVATCMQPRASPHAAPPLCIPRQHTRISLRRVGSAHDVSGVGGWVGVPPFAASCQPWYPPRTLGTDRDELEMGRQRCANALRNLGRQWCALTLFGCRVGAHLFGRCGVRVGHKRKPISAIPLLFDSSIMAMDVEAWRVQANFGPTIGVHTGVRLLRYRKAGPVFIQLEQLAEVFTIAKTTLRDAMREFEDGYYVEDRAEVLQELRHHGFVGGCASKVVILRLAFAEKLLRTFDVDQHARDVLCSLASTSPPPRPPRPPSATKSPARWGAHA
jgi:hypothetical protein